MQSCISRFCCYFCLPICCWASWPVKNIICHKFSQRNLAFSFFATSEISSQMKGTAFSVHILFATAAISGVIADFFQVHFANHKIFSNKLVCLSKSETFTTFTNRPQPHKQYTPPIIAESITPRLEFSNTQGSNHLKQCPKFLRNTSV